MLLKAWIPLQGGRNREEPLGIRTQAKVRRPLPVRLHLRSPLSWDSSAKLALGESAETKLKHDSALQFATGP